jgi:NAD-dependent dihydropyrimidine dehydrogenase PreA subunit
MPKNTLTIYCHCAYYKIVPEQTKSAVLNAIKNTGMEFEPVADLCKMAAHRDPSLKTWTKADSIRIIACYPRAVRWLFHAGGAPLSKEGIEFFNMRVDGPEKIISSLADPSPAKMPSRTLKDIRPQQPGDWIPWFPVIDYDRCKNCKQCFNFCLFGVYKLSAEDKVEVQNPAGCKTNCPACARLCPQSAIIFPKYTGSPINGDEVDESSPGGLSDEKVKVDVAQLLSGNVYQALRQRSKIIERLSKNTNDKSPPRV